MKLNVICVNVGNKYSNQYVENLYNMVKRNLTFDFTFWCITDRQQSPHINTLLPPAGIKSWWNKLWMFSKDANLVGTNLYFDLDVVICGSLDKFVKFDGDFCILQDFNRAFHPTYQVYNSSIMRWSNDYHSMWDEFSINPKFWQEKYHGDQDWITRKIPNAQFWPKDWAISWKWEYPKELTNDTSVLVFHGNPKPHEIDHELIRNHWK